MRFITITLIVHAPDPVTGEQKSTQDRLREVLGNARLAEELGFDGFGVGERHERPFISSSPTVVLSHVAALTTRIRLFTAVTTLSLLDPVRAFEDYDAVEAYRPVFAGYLAMQSRLGVTPVFPTLEDFVERSSALIGSPAQVIEKVHRYHEQFGHSVLHLHADAGGLTDARHRASLELFQSDIAPVLRREIPDPPWGWGGGPIGDDAIKAGAIKAGAIKAGTVPARAGATAG
jgi:alkanesulfonate monooxygenase SsuD/methylene tetrahydromethanopterin reductase-like flavin-dependent oxidoreductase (luciferase family)